MKKLVCLLLCAVHFVVCFNAVAETTTGEKTIININVGDTFIVDNVKVEITEYKQLNELRFTQQETGSFAHSLHKAMNDATYLTLVCEIENMGKSELAFDAFVGNVIVGGYEYDLGQFSPRHGAVPFEEAKVYFYALVPKNLVRGVEDVKFRFSFDEKVAWEGLWEFDAQYDHQYIVDAK